MNWTQLGAIAWLRWRLTRNQLGRGGQLNAAASLIFVSFTLAAGAALGFGGVVLGIALSQAAPVKIMLLWDGVFFMFFFFWFGSLMVEIQRSEIIDIPRLLHLPVTLGQVFALNYLASHFTPVLVVAVPGMLGVAAGLVLGAGPAMVLVFPVVVGVVLAVTAWTYCLRGWLASIMISKRKRRTIFVWITLAFVALGQAPNLLFNSPGFRQRQEHTQAKGPESLSTLPPSVLDAHAIVPFGWPGYAAMRLKEGRPAAALGMAAGAFLIAVLGLARAYRSTIRFYRGAEPPPHARVAMAHGAGVDRATPERGPPKTMLVERRLPAIAGDTAALALATFRSLTRAPELKMALAMPIILCVVLGGMHLGRPSSIAATGEMFGTVGTTAVAGIAMFTLAPTMSNMFGLDRSAFRGLVLLPTSRTSILFAKNLAFFPFVAGTNVLTLLLATWAIRFPWRIVLVGALQIPTVFLLFAPVCNLFSIVLPYRFSEGGLNAQRPKAIVVLAGFAAMLATPIILAPTLIPAAVRWLVAASHWDAPLPLDAVAALAVLAGAAWLYRALLPVEGRLLQRREQKILREVTAEVE